MSKKKKLIIAIIITLVVLGAIIAVLAILKNRTKEKKVVSVMPVEMLYTPAEYMEYNNTLYGYVDISLEQKIYLSSTDVIEEICVTEGQHVKAGDVILIYDMTARELELEMMRANVEQARVDVLVAERELEELKAIVPVEELPEPPTTEEQEPTTEVQEPGTEEQPPSTEEQPPSTEEQPPSTEEQPPSTEEQEPSTEEQPPSTEEQPPSTDEQEPSTEEQQPGIFNVDLRTSNPFVQEPEIPEDVVDDSNDEELEETYTKEELDELISAKESEIKSLQIAYQLIQIDLELLEYQSDSGEVLCNFDGVVTSVKDPEEANLNGEPYIIISGTNGCSVKSSIGELSLGDVSIGDEVEMYCYENGMYYTGVITEISDTPTSEGGYSAMTESFYPITITVEDGEGLSSYMGMDITKPAEYVEDSEAFYLPLAYVASENGKYYVLRDNNGKLEKAYIKTGTIMWGDSIKILGGVSLDDYIAFPHASDAKEGVRTKKDDGSSWFY